MVKLTEQHLLRSQPAIGSAPVYPSTAAIRGHPIHVMLVGFPVTFLTTALITDIIFVSTDLAVWAEASRWLLGAGIVTGLLAAVFGIIDFLTIPRVRAHMHGWLHPIAAVSSVLLALVNLLIRWNDPTALLVPWGIGLSALMIIVLVGAGWLGGELVHRHRIGIMAFEPGEREAVLPMLRRGGEVDAGAEAEVGGRFVPKSDLVHEETRPLP